MYYYYYYYYVLTKCKHVLVCSVHIIPEIVKFLLAKDGIDVNVCDNGKMTALHWALKLSASECLTLLFAADVGPSVVIANRKGVYPLHTAGKR